MLNTMQALSVEISLLKLNLRHPWKTLVASLEVKAPEIQLVVEVPAALVVQEQEAQEAHLADPVDLPAAVLVLQKKLKAHLKHQLRMTWESMEKSYTLT